MICKKCGTEFTEGIFCPECGAKSEKIETVVKIQSTQSSQKNGSVSSGMMQTRKQDISRNMPKKAMSFKSLTRLGVIILSIIVIAFIVANWEGKTDYVASVKAHTPFAISQGLPYTYEEVLNQYFDSLEWKVHKDGDIHYVDISGTVKEMGSKFTLTIKVSDNPDDPNSARINPESVTFDDTTQLSGGEASDFLYILFCLYDEGYEDLTVLMELEKETEYISQGEVSLTDTFTDSDSEPDICFNGIAVSELLDFSGFQVIQMFGDDYYAGADGSMVYDEIEFYMIDDITIGCITSFYPENFSINGYSLDDDSGEGVYCDRIIDLLGTDYEEEYLDWYYITYHYPAYTASFSVSKYNEVGNIKIYSNLYEQSGLTEDALLESQEPIEYYQRLGGSYSANMGQSTLILSIYSSQEEGEIEIGSAVIYADDGQYFGGSLIPIDMGKYMVTTDTGEEVLLIELPLSDEVILELYVDGQCIEQYQMTEHYVP